MITSFPCVDDADEYGLLAVGGDVEVPSLLLAYRCGIFPWPVGKEGTLAWFAPAKRSLLFIGEAHVSRSVRRAEKRSSYEIRCNTSFETIIRSCQRSYNRKDGQGSWITEELIQGYLGLHRAGHAHSVECWQSNKLVGGLYGVAIGGMFAGESMYYTEANSSKVALAWLIEHLAAQGVGWIDCQQQTELLGSFGAREIPRQEFMRLLGVALQLPAISFPREETKGTES